VRKGGLIWSRGWYELRDPLTYLKPEKEVDKTMRDFSEREGEEIPV
jgi:hypothetical protein